MAKKRKQSQKQKEKREDALEVKDRLGSDVFAKLKEKQKELKAVEEKHAEEEKQRKIKEKKEREKNKSFEELFEESNMNWKEYK
ncbi:DUF3886 domain-containing protein [Bacillus solimangrovi]